MVNVVGAESCRKITRHLPVVQCRRVQRPPCLCRDEQEDVGEEVPVISRPGWPSTGFAGAHYPPVIGSRFRVTRLPAWPAPLVFPPFLGARGGTGLQRDGLLDMTVSSDGPVGCSRMDKASEIGRSPGSRVSPLRFLARRFP